MQRSEKVDSGWKLQVTAMKKETSKVISEDSRRKQRDTEAAQNQEVSLEVCIGRKS